MSEITFFAKTNFRNQEREFGIKTDDRRRHVYVIGKTGMGKTNLLENMVIQDIQNGHGVCYIDPHGDTAEKLMKAIPAERINDVIYFNPADQNFPVAFNVMETIDPEYRHLVASGLVGVFKKIWADSWGPRLEYILRNAILALLEYPGSTLLGVTRILVDKKYRSRIVNKVTDPVVKAFWVDEFSQWNERVLQEVISPIQNKVGQFLSSALIRNVVGQAKSSFDVREVMDGQKILIMNLSKGRIGEDTSALLGAMMITKIQLAAMARVDMNEKDRNDFYLFVDEFQNFATESFANILSEARKYRLNLILANQYVTQIEETVRDAIFGNAGTIISFRVGATDAEFLEKEFAPVFTENDLVNLPKYNVYLKLMIDGIAGDAFSATTLPPINLGKTEGNEEKILAVSRERYASDRATVEEKIARWSGMLPEGDFEITPPTDRAPLPTKPALQNKKTQESSINTAVSQVSQESQRSKVVAEKNPIESDGPPKETAPQVYKSVCATCDLEINVPFEPDGKRPTFCRECLKDYQRAVAKAKERAMDVQEVDITKTPPITNEVTLKARKNDEKENIQATRRDKDVQKRTAPRSYISKEGPMGLNQLQHIAPKKFKSLKKRPEVNLDEVRDLIQKNKKK